MALVRVCKVVEAPAAPLFRALVDWGGWGSWLPLIEESSLESGGPGTVGSVRVVGPAGGPGTRERLTGCDEVALTIWYTIVGPPPPIRAYVACVRLLALTDRPATVVDWSATIDADADAEGELRSRFETYLEMFVDALATGVGAAAG